MPADPVTSPSPCRARSQTFGAPVPGCGGQQPPGSAGGAGPGRIVPPGRCPHTKVAGGRRRHGARRGSPVPKMVAERGGPGPVTPRLPWGYRRLLFLGGFPHPAQLYPGRGSFCCGWGVPTWPVPARGGGLGGSCRAFLPHPGEAGGLRGAPRRSLCGSAEPPGDPRCLHRLPCPPPRERARLSHLLTRFFPVELFRVVCLGFGFVGLLVWFFPPFTYVLILILMCAANVP